MKPKSPVVVIYGTTGPECYHEERSVACPSILSWANVPIEVLQHIHHAYYSWMGELLRLALSEPVVLVVIGLLTVLIVLAIFRLVEMVLLLVGIALKKEREKAEEARRGAEEAERRLEEEKKTAKAEKENLMGTLKKIEDEKKEALRREEYAREKEEHAKRKEDVARRDARAAQLRAEEEIQRSNRLLEMRIAQDENFQNLNDPTRLEKLVQKYKDLENNERLDVLDVLETSGMDRREYMEFPALVVMETFRLAVDHLKKCQEDVLAAINATGKSASGGLQESMVLEVKRELRKRAARSSADPLINDFTNEAVQNLKANQHSDVKNFVSSCSCLTWLMVLQATPVVPVMSTPGVSINVNVFRRHVESKAGQALDVTIWPALVRGGNTSDEKAMAHGCVMAEDDK